MPLFFRRKADIAIVEVHGVIGSHVREPVYSRLFDNIARSRRHRALVVDINSPGGSATASDLLYHNLKKVGRHKPVVAYVRGMSASGGYYLCCGATHVVSLPTALVGSIGVIYLRPILEQLLQRVGIEMSVYKGGRLKDMTGFWRSPTGEEAAKHQQLVGEMYDTFVDIVASNRNLERDRVLELATGEVFTARRAREMGLVDEFGDFDRALEIAAQRAGIPPRPRWVRPRRSFSEKLMGRGDSRRMDLGFLPVELPRLLAGGLYYIEPSLVTGDY